MRHRGIVNWFNAQKGFGFIRRNDGTGDIFVHYSNLTMTGFKSLEKDQVVEFSEATTEKGLQAVDVTILTAEQLSK